MVGIYDNLHAAGESFCMLPCRCFKHQQIQVGSVRSVRKQCMAGFVQERPDGMWAVRVAVDNLSGCRGPGEAASGRIGERGES